jgi:hypothetical protein
MAFESPVEKGTYFLGTATGWLGSAGLTPEGSGFRFGSCGMGQVRRWFRKAHTAKDSTHVNSMEPLHHQRRAVSRIVPKRQTVSMTDVMIPTPLWWQGSVRGLVVAILCRRLWCSRPGTPRREGGSQARQVAFIIGW